MSIEANDDLIGLWFISFDERDVMAGLARKGTGFRLIYRVRHYEPDPKEDPFNDNDVKSWYHVDIQPPADSKDLLAETLLRVRAWVRAIVLIGAEQSYELLRMPAESTDSFMERLTKMPFAHVKQLSAEEYERQFGKNGEPT